MWWYIVLAILGASLGAFTLWKHKDPKLFVLFFALSGLINPFETLILIYFESYSYSVGLFENLYKDSIVGHFVSNLLIVPSVIVYMIANQKKINWYLFSAFILAGIEELFVALNIFHHYTWKSVYTFLFLLLYFSLSYIIWKKVSVKPNKFTLFIVTALAGVSIHGVITFLFLGATGKILFTSGIFSDPFRDHLVIASPFLLFIGFVVSFFVTFTVRLQYLLSLIVIISFDVLFVLFDILTFESNFSMLLFISIHFFGIWTMIKFSNWLTDN